MAKQVIDREKSSVVVVAGIKEHGPAIGATLAETLRPFAADGAVPDVALLLSLIGKFVAHRAATLVLANDAHERELSDDAAPRARRDAAEEALRPPIVRLRATIDGAYGEVGLRELGLWDPPATGPDAVRSYGRAVCKALLEPNLTLTPLDGAVVKFDRALAAARLQPLVDALDAALADVARERSEADTTLLAKQDAMTAHDRDFVRFAGVVEQLARAAGKDELANRIRPSGREPGVLAEPIDDVVVVDGPSPTNGGAAPAATPKPRIAPGMPGAEPFDDEA